MNITPRDWIEDFADEDNGDYQKTCGVCKLEFRGHKRRLPTCKSCWITFAQRIVREHNRKVLAAQK